MFLRRLEWMWAERLEGEQEDVDRMRMTNRSQP